MIDGDTAVLDELCSDDFIYTHSKGDHDDKRSYLHKVGSRYFTFIEITHPADTAAMRFWALLASGQINMRKVDGWQTLAANLIGQPIDLAA